MTFTLEVQGSAPRTNYDSTQLPFLLDIVPKASAGQRQAMLNIKERNLPAMFEYLPSVLNPDEAVELEIYTSLPTNYNIIVEGKILDGTITPPLKVAEFPSVTSRMTPKQMIFGGINMLFGARWVTIGIFSILVLATVLLSLGVFAFCDDNDWDSPIYLVIFVVTLLIDLIFIVGLVFSVIT